MVVVGQAARKAGAWSQCPCIECPLPAPPCRPPPCRAVRYASWMAGSAVLAPTARSAGSGRRGGLGWGGENRGGEVRRANPARDAAHVLLLVGWLVA